MKTGNPDHDSDGPPGWNSLSCRGESGRFPADKENLEKAVTPGVSEVGEAAWCPFLPQKSFSFEASSQKNRLFRTGIFHVNRETMC